VEHVFRREDRRFSRFRPDSELSRVNAAAGQWVQVSHPFAILTERSLRAAAETDGLFDPTVLPALAAAGYDRDWAEVEARGIEEDEELAAIRRDFAALMIKHGTACGAWREIELDGTNLRIPEGAELDFGGIAKGWTVDRAAGELPNLCWAIVNAGGDLRVMGTPPRAGLEIGIEDPDDAGVEAFRLGLSAGALATTSVTVRAWGQGNHHVIDPRTSLPAMTNVVQATVWGETCADAEVWSKAALLRGPEILDRVSAGLVLASGEVVTNLPIADNEQVPA
jgi:thiamine biosynthesis lipoprotein